MVGYGIFIDQSLNMLLRDNLYEYKNDSLDICKLGGIYMNLYINSFSLYTGAKADIHDCLHTIILL